MVQVSKDFSEPTLGFRLLAMDCLVFRSRFPLESLPKNTCNSHEPGLRCRIDPFIQKLQCIFSSSRTDLHIRRKRPSSDRFHR